MKFNKLFISLCILSAIRINGMEKDTPAEQSDFQNLPDEPMYKIALQDTTLAGIVKNITRLKLINRNLYHRLRNSAFLNYIFSHCSWQNLNEQQTAALRDFLTDTFATHTAPDPNLRSLDSRHAEKFAQAIKLFETDPELRLGLPWGFDLSKLRVVASCALPGTADHVLYSTIHSLVYHCAHDELKKELRALANPHFENKYEALIEFMLALLSFKNDDPILGSLNGSGLMLALVDVCMNFDANDGDLIEGSAHGCIEDVAKITDILIRQDKPASVQQETAIIVALCFALLYENSDASGVLFKPSYTQVFSRLLTLLYQNQTITGHQLITLLKSCLRPCVFYPHSDALECICLFIHKLSDDNKVILTAELLKLLPQISLSVWEEGISILRNLDLISEEVFQRDQAVIEDESRYADKD
jgi:hypothetical protein